MSFGKNYGDSCENEECPSHREGKCRKNEEFYDQSISKNEKIQMLVETLSPLMLMSEQINDEIKTLINIGHSIIDNDTDDILKEIEERINKE